MAYLGGKTMRRLAWPVAILCGALWACTDVDSPGPDPADPEAQPHEEEVFPSTPNESLPPLKSSEYHEAVFDQGRWYTRGRSRPIDMIIIHTTEGSYNGAISWFKSRDNRYRTSAHYVIRSSDGHITQMVREANTAHHVRRYNSRSIGLEHEAISAQPRWFTDAMYRSSARLVGHLCRKYNLPVDRTHIRSHAELDPGRRSDPGPHWDWDRYMELVREAAGAPAGGAGNLPADGQCNATTWTCNSTRSARYFCRSGNVIQSENCSAGCQPGNVGQNDRCRPSSDGGNYGQCTANGSVGTCINESDCGGTVTARRCPGAAAIKCCTDVPDRDPPEEPEEKPDDPRPDPVVPGVGTACTAHNQQGTCQTVATCSAQGNVSTSGRCSGAASVQCCTPPEPTPPPRGVGTACTARNQRGTCQLVSDCGGVSTSGRCPGSANVQCCTPN